MPDTQIIQVRLPGGAQPTPAELGALQHIFEAIVTLRFAGGAGSAEAALTGDGWAVRTRLAWVAEASRGAEFEEATGASKAEALEHLQQLVKADRVLSAL